MWSDLFRNHRVPALAFLLVLAISIVAGFRFAAGPEFWNRGPRELRRNELTLRDGLLFASGETNPFTGRLYDTYSEDVRKLEIEIDDGKASGRSLGYYPNLQLEVEEFFVDGTSHGIRTRRYENGVKRSVETIVHGQVNGPYTEWHENGQKHVQMTLRDGKPDGLAEAWHPIRCAEVPHPV